MSNDPTSVLEATEPVLNIESIKEIMDAFDPASLLPELDSIFGWITFACRIAVVVGPIVLLVLGLVYLFLSPREANHYLGYRCYFGMGSVEAWRFTQRLAGIVLGGLGLVLTGIMLILSGTFASMEVNDMVWRAVKCLIWEGALALIANLAISLTAMFRFDAKGNYRKRR